jgi:glycosyltransferase involved in cell wall biosynthesis
MSDSKPLVTFALVAYNQEHFIAEAVAGALSQTFSPLEIIISDDCSTDHTFKIIQEQVAEYRGPHKIRLNQNERNIGFGSHINRVMEMATGTLIVVAAGDDVSLHNRVERLYSVYNSSGRKAMSIFSNAIVIDESGNKEQLCGQKIDPQTLSLYWLAKHMGGAMGCSHAWDRRLFDLFGPMDKEVIHEDVVISFRAALLGKIEYLNEVLVLYRRHGNNIHFTEPKDIKDTLALYSLLRKSADSKIAIYRNRLQDLNLALQLYPDRQIEFSRLQKITRRMLREMENEKSLLLCSNFLKRTSIIAQALWQGAPLARVIRWILTFFFPRLYITYQRYLRARALNANKI